MFDKIPTIGHSWLGALLSFTIIILIYYSVWMLALIFLFHKATKDIFIYKREGKANLIISFCVLIFLIIGFNMSMLAFGLYSEPNPDWLFLFLFSILFSGMITTMIYHMSSTNLSGGEEFYNAVISFVLGIAFLSPTKGLLTFTIQDKLYLLGGMIITFFLYSLNKFTDIIRPLISWYDRVIRKLDEEDNMKNTLKKIKGKKAQMQWFLIIILLFMILYLLWKSGYLS